MDAAGEAPYPIEAATRLSGSCLWRLQRAYFERAGIDAWRRNIVPHYVTSNPVLAEAYAAVVLGWLRDELRQGADPAAPFFVLELGAGSGRFSFYLLSALAALRAIGPPLPRLSYVMSDIVPANLEFWRRHPSLADFVADGTLDFALFDIEQDTTLPLAASGDALAAGGLANPLLVIANYVFDGIPQDAFAWRAGRLFERRVALAAAVPEPGLDDLQCTLSDHPAPEPPYAEPEFCALLAEGAPGRDGASVLFPAAALRGLTRLSALAGGRMALLTADRGGLCVPPGLENGGELLLHGSISLPVNYHAIAACLRRAGGSVLASEHSPRSLAILACLPGPAAAFPETGLAFAQAVERAGPDAFFTLRRGIAPHYAELELPHLLALLRLSRWDPKILGDCAPALTTRIGDAGEQDRAELLGALRRCCRNYYRLGPDRDWSIATASLFLALGAPAAALRLLQQEEMAGGADARLNWDIGLCQSALGAGGAAARSFAAALRLDPDLPRRSYLFG